MKPSSGMGFFMSMGVRAPCRHLGCTKKGGSFGMCAEHEPALIEEQFEWAVADGLCPRERPPCFRGETEWKEYIVASLMCRDKGERQTTPIDHCRDCTPAYRKQMVAEEKCEHPETVFIRTTRHGDVVGVPIHFRVKSTRMWENAVMGFDGDVVDMPPPAVIHGMLNRIADLNAPKRRGRPKGTPAPSGVKRKPGRPRKSEANHYEEAA